jgi:hypothetical protein
VRASESRPAYLDEFERKLAAALAQQADAKKPRLASVRSSDVDLSASSSPSLEEALTRSSPGRVAERPLNVRRPQPSSETREGRTPNHEATTVSVQHADSAIAVEVATAPLAGGSGAVGASQPAAGLSHRNAFESAVKVSSMEMPARQPVAPPADLADASSADDAPRPARRTEELIGVPAEMVETAAAATEVLQAMADAFAQGGGNGPEKGIAAVEAVVREAARPIGAANLHAHKTGVTDATKRRPRSWRVKALALMVSVAMVGAVFMRVGGMLAPASEAPGAAVPKSLRENMTPDQDAAEQAPSAEAPSPSAASSAGSDLLKGRPEVNSAAVVATPTAPQAAKTAAVDAIQPAGGLSSETPPASIVSIPGAATPAPPLAQSFDVKPVPTVSLQLTPITDPIQSAALPTEGLSEGHAPEPTAEPTRNEHGVGVTKPLAPERDARVKIADKPSTQAVITKNHATSHRVAARTPSEPLPHGTPAKLDNSAKEPKPKAAQAAVESAAAAATPGATPQPGGLY